MYWRTFNANFNNLINDAVEEVVEDIWKPFNRKGQSWEYKGGKIVARLAIPGVKKEDLNVTLEDGILTIEAEVKKEEQEKIEVK